MMTYGQMILFFFIAFICVFALVNRICTCIERSTMNKCIEKLGSVDGIVKKVAELNKD